MTLLDPGSHLWAGADAYERFMGRWSRGLARSFVLWLGVPAGRHWLEVGCGTGALTTQISQIARPASIMATDPSETFITHARATLLDERVRFMIASAGDLPARTAGYDAVVSALVLNFLPDPAAALREMGSLTAGGGVVAACVWDYAGEMQFLRRFWDAAVELDPAALQWDEGARFPICSPTGLEDAFRRTGFSDLRSEALEIPTRFRDFDDFWTPFVGGPGPAPGYLASLSDRRQEELRQRLSDTLPRGEDGSVPLLARAWAAQARMHTGRTRYS